VTFFGGGGGGRLLSIIILCAADLCAVSSDFLFISTSILPLQPVAFQLNLLMCPILLFAIPSSSFLACYFGFQ
jgi:hypothetical protein